MFVRCWVICVFLHLIDKVSLQEPVPIQGFVGGFVTLPCSFKERVLKPDEINVFWRFNKSMVVHSIENNSPSTKKQDAVFTGRIESFPSQYENGNFSLRLNNLKVTDNGKFSCFIADVDKKLILELHVKETAPAPTMKPRNASMKAQPAGIVTLLLFVGLYLSFPRALIC